MCCPVCNGDFICEGSLNKCACESVMTRASAAFRRHVNAITVYSSPF